MKWLLSILVISLLLYGIPVYAANVCDPVRGIDCGGVNSTATGGGLHEGGYDQQQNFTGQRATYSAGLEVTDTVPLGLFAYFAICGSSTKKVVIQNFNTGATITGAAGNDRVSVILKRTRTPITGGTEVILVPIAFDSLSGAPSVSLLNVYTAAPTGGESVGVVGIETKVLPQAPAANDSIIEIIFNFAKYESGGIVLRGPSQCMEASMAPTSPATRSIAVSIVWTEETEYVVR